MTNTITLEIEAAEAAVDALGRHAFPAFHAITNTGEWTLTTAISRSFNVLQLMHGLGLAVDPGYQYRPGAFESRCTRADYAAINAITTSGHDWGGTEPGQWPSVTEEFGAEATQNALSLLDDSAEIGDLATDYFFLEQLSRAEAESKLTRYAELLRTARAAYENAGWT